MSEGSNETAPEVFRRDPSASYPLAVAGDGAVVIDAEGRRRIDAASGVFVAILGFAPSAVAEHVALRLRTLPFAYGGTFANADEDRLARLLIERAPPGMAKVWLTTSGSTANETALKLARQYHTLRGNAEKTVVIARWHSYHGSTVGAMSMSGSIPRRQPYQPYLLDFPHVDPPYCYRCRRGLVPESCGGACAADIEEVISKIGARHVSAVILEPVAGAPLGALVSPDHWLWRVRAICDRHDVLLIVDEIVSGTGRTGDWFAIAASGVVPDLITLGKGLGGGLVPIGAVVVHERVVQAFEAEAAAFVHSESFTGHAVVGAAGTAVIEYMEATGMLDRVRELGLRLDQLLRPLRSHPLVGEVRGRGLLRGLELVQDKATRAPFPRARRVAEAVVAAARRRDVLFLVGNAAADGQNGDTIIIAPPYVTVDGQLDTIVSTLVDALDDVAMSLS